MKLKTASDTPTEVKGKKKKRKGKRGKAVEKKGNDRISQNHDGGGGEVRHKCPKMLNSGRRGEGGEGAIPTLPRPTERTKLIF